MSIFVESNETVNERHNKDSKKQPIWKFFERFFIFKFTVRRVLTVNRQDLGKR